MHIKGMPELFILPFIQEKNRCHAYQRLVLVSINTFADLLWFRFSPFKPTVDVLIKKQQLMMTNSRAKSSARLSKLIKRWRINCSGKVFMCVKWAGCVPGWRWQLLEMVGI